MTLMDAQIGAWVRVIGFDHQVQDRLLQHGLYPGDRARVVRVAPLSGPLLVEVAGREIALGRRVASKILVEAE